jgi:hypothetical protein
MDDFNVSTLHESRNEWCARLLTILTPLIIDGYNSILDEAILICKSHNEKEKYLMTFQNFISRVPKWNPTIIETERKRICEKSGCSYLEDLVTCIHVIQLKVLTAMRVGQKQKKIDINIPKINDFIHNVYINVARRIYKLVYLFEINIQPLQIQKNARELEVIVQECILTTVRESIPIESILKAYMYETIEEDVVEEIKEEIKDEPLNNEQNNNPVKHLVSSEHVKESKLTFNDVDMVTNSNNVVESIIAPKTIERLEEISNERNLQRKLESDEDDNIKLNISNEEFKLDNLDIHSIDEPPLELLPELNLDEIEVI